MRTSCRLRNVVRDYSKIQPKKSTGYIGIFLIEDDDVYSSSSF